MARRIEIELTSTRADGSWSWRAAGALQPRGVLDGGLLSEGSKAGDVLRADAEFGIDGIVITNVLPPKDKKRAEPQRIELKPSRADTPGVTTQLLGRGARPGGRDGGPARRDSRPGERREPRPADGRQGRPADGRPSRPADSREGTERSSRQPRPRRDGGSGSGERRDRRPESDERRSQGAGPSRQPAGPRRDGSDRGGAGREGVGRSGDSGRPRSRRLSPGHTHRHAVMASLPPEEQAVAEQVLRGGIPAVRTAVHLEREKATAEGRPAPDANQLLTLAESLLPRLKAAEWHDRAEAAVKAATDLPLRDLRSVVAGADVARDEETRQLATQLRESLDARVEALRSDWVADLIRHLDQGRVVRALQLAARPPDPSTRLPADLAGRASEAASASLSPDTPPERWLALLEAAAASPVRRSVVPTGLPADPGPDLLRAAHQQSGRIPALATLLGLSIPPPPGPRAGSAPRRPPGRAGRPAADDRETAPPPPVSTTGADRTTASTPPPPAGTPAAEGPSSDDLTTTSIDQPTH